MPPIDRYQAISGSSGPAQKFFDITPSDTQELPFLTVAIYVGGAGDVALRDRETGAVVIHYAAAAGSYIPVRVGQIMATGTTATRLVGWA